MDLSKRLHEMTSIGKRAAPEQGGVISGINPVEFTTTDPIRTWIIQIAIILGMTQLLSLIMSRIRQPRVIAEVITGVLLGPTVMGRIPNFTNSIFPSASVPYLSLTATIGLVLFLFLTALEVDVRIIQRNAKGTSAISLAGIVLPFGLGAAVAVPIYHNFVNPVNNFGYFVLFVGVAMSITAFPVLCRILTELKLLDTTVGVVTLSAGVGNDVIGWVLLALTVALVNASGGLTALYVLLASVAWTLFMLFPVKWAFHFLLRRTGSLEKGQPTPFIMIVILLMVFISAFMTDILGVHAIFGAFIAGLIIPHENGFAISLVEKLEDFITIILVPIYFTLSGLKTNLGLLNTGKAWGYTILLCAIAFVGKFVGCVAAARVFKFNWRESSTIGVLMSCKGLVELIVLNIGLQAGILDQRLFSMFVVMALVLTFMTTPIVLTIYPPKYRKLGADADVSKEKTDEEHKVTPPSAGPRDEAGFKSRFSVILNKLEHVPAIMTLTQLLQPSSSSVTLAPSTNGEDPSTESNPRMASTDSPVQLDALRLIELTDRTSAVMQSSEADDIIRRDALLSIVRTFGYINAMPVTTSLSVVPFESFSDSVASHARDKESDLVVIPWYAGPEESAQTGAFNPFENLFGQGKGTVNEKSSLAIYSHFVRHVFANNPSDVVLFVDRGISLLTEGQQAVYGQHILFPFFGGPDDRLALAFVIQLCANTSITATIVRIKIAEKDTLTPTETGETDLKAPPVPHSATVMSHSGFPDTLYAPPTTQTRMESQSADGILFSRFTGQGRSALPVNIQAALTRVKFEELETAAPLAALIQRANEESAGLVQTKKGLLLVTGRGRRMTVASHHEELKTIIQQYTDKGLGRISGDVSRTLGEVATAFMAGVKANLLVMQAAMPTIQE